MRRSVGESLLFSAFIVVLLMAPGFVKDLEPLPQLCILLIIDALLFLYLFYLNNVRGEFSRENQELHKKNFLWLLPVFIPLLGILIFFIFSGTLDSLSILWALLYASDNYDISLALLRFLAIVQFALSALINEMVFRMHFFKLIRTRERWLKIIISAGIFALFDVLMFLQENVLFIDVAYSMLISFLLGIVLGAIVEYGHCIYFAMLFHFVFKVAYWDFELMFVGRYGPYWFTNPVIWLLICVAFLVVVYFVKFRKKDVYDV